MHRGGWITWTAAIVTVAAAAVYALATRVDGPSDLSIAAAGASLGLSAGAGWAIIAARRSPAGSAIDALEALADETELTLAQANLTDLDLLPIIAKLRTGLAVRTRSLSSGELGRWELVTTRVALCLREATARVRDLSILDRALHIEVSEAKRVRRITAEELIDLRDEDIDLRDEENATTAAPSDPGGAIEPVGRRSQ